jgi:methionyl-tRNA formyltransferase
MLMLDAVNQLADDPDYVFERQSRDPADALRCYSRRPEDGRIDWRQPAMDVLRLINASNKPYTGAYCEFEGEKMIIWDAELVDDKENYCAVLGQVTLIGEGFVEVACSDGKIRIKEIEMNGKAIKPSALISSTRKRLL